MKPSGQLLDALYRWATIERTGLDLGYPKECPTTKGYRPYAVARDNPRTPLEGELELLELVCRGINAIMRDEEKAYRALQYRYGAYPNAPESLGHRDLVGKANLGEKNYWRHLQNAHRRLQGIVDVYA